MNFGRDFKGLGDFGGFMSLGWCFTGLGFTGLGFKVERCYNLGEAGSELATPLLVPRPEPSTNARTFVAEQPVNPKP